MSTGILFWATLYTALFALLHLLILTATENALVYSKHRRFSTGIAHGMRVSWAQVKGSTGGRR